MKPEFSKLNGHDPVAFILSSNIARRHMTKGQQAMAVAMIYPEVEDPKHSGAKGGNAKPVGFQKLKAYLSTPAPSL